MPRPGRSYIRGIFASALLHTAALGFILWHSRSSWVDSGAGATIPAGGGGGQGGAVTYIELPAYRTAAKIEPVRSQPDLPVPVLVQPEPPTQTRPLALAPLSIPLASVEIPPAGTGVGSGPGTGGGIGSGVGSGVGPGVGSGVGPGGAGEAVFPPEPKYSILPPLPKPASVRGQTYRVRFSVDARGRVTMVDVTPRIPDGEYRKKFLDLMREYTFTPARRADGTPVRGIAEIAITL
jgi:protein TonB